MFVNQIPLPMYPGCPFSSTEATDSRSPFWAAARSPNTSNPAADPCNSSWAGVVDTALTVKLFVSGGLT